MKVKTRKKDKNFAIVHKNLLLSSVSLEAKGLCAFLELYSNDFEVAFQTICDRNNKSEKTIRKYIKELERNSFVYRFQNKHTCEIIWYIDSETLDYGFVFADIKKIWKAHQIRHLTDCQILAREELPREEFPTYKNITGEDTELSDLQYMEILKQLQENKEIDWDKINNSINKELRGYA